MPTPPLVNISPATPGPKNPVVFTDVWNGICPVVPLAKLVEMTGTLDEEDTETHIVAL